jgi:hypothetical protein
MTVLQIIYLVLGFFTYWVVKIPATLKGDNHVNTLKDFGADNFKEIILSVIGLVFLIFAGPAYPEYINLTSPVTIFVSGGAIPSMFNNLIGAFGKKNNSSLELQKEP